MASPCHIPDGSQDEKSSGSGILEPFAIDRSTGKITVANPSLLKVGQTWKLRIRVTDAVGATSDATFTIRLVPGTLSALIIPSDKTKEGQLIEAVALPWFEMMAMIKNDADFVYSIPWRKWEEIIAGAYHRAGWDEVILTPASNDKGRDVIAVKKGVGAIRFLEQVKAYAPDHRVTAEEVRAFYGVLSSDQNATKGIITTTSEFAPGVEAEYQNMIPFRLELKPKDVLIPWLMSIYQAPTKP